MGIHRFDTSFLTDDLLSVQSEHERRMSDLLTGGQPDRVPLFDYAAFELPRVGDYDREQWLTKGLSHFRTHYESYCDAVTWRIPALALCRYGLHFTSAVLGCRVWAEADQPWCVSLSELGQTPQDFQVPDLDQNSVFQEMLGLLRFVTEVTEGRVVVELPFLAEPLLAAVDLFGTEFLRLLADDGELAGQLLEKVSTVVLAMRSRFRGVGADADADVRDYHTCACPMPGDFRFVHGCTTHLVGPATYRDYVAPLDAAHLQHEGRGGCLHLCGRHTQHISTWRDLPGLCAVQLNDTAACDFERYWRGLLQDQFVVLWPGSTMSVAEALRISHGHRLALRHAASKPLPVTSRKE